MNLLSRPLVLLLLCSLVTALFWLVPEAHSQVVINEVLGDPGQDWNGDGEVDYKSDEWIEVRNVGTDSEDLSQYWLRDGTGDDPHFQLIGTLEPGQVVVFYGSDAVLWQQEQGHSTLGFSINNSGETLELMQGSLEKTGAALVVVDQVTLSGHEVEDDRSSGLNQDTGLWTLFDALNPYGGALEPQGSSCVPSPGEPNECSPLVPVTGITWGQLKSQYR